MRTSSCRACWQMLTANTIDARHTCEAQLSAPVAKKKIEDRLKNCYKEA